jgi:predicted metal-dependent peptidase
MTSAAHGSHVDPGAAPTQASVDEQFQVRRFSACQLALLDEYPFFGTLMLMAPVVLTQDVDTAATDGRNLLFNPGFIASLTGSQLRGLVVHEVLHCALLHVPRRGVRDPLLWNIAADVHVNGLIGQEPNLALPAGAVQDRSLEHHSVEEIYELLRKRAPAALPKLALRDLRQPAAAGASGAGGRGEAPDAIGAAALEAYWSNALNRALAVTAMSGRGNLPAGLLREVRETAAPRLDWRTALWRFMVRTPDDFGAFDRRHVWQGLYVETLEGETIDVDVCIDTSGSVGPEQLALFLGEVRGVLSAYPVVRCRLWYADARCVGPFDVQADRPLPAPRGGGGTDFRPFFRAIDELAGPAGAGALQGTNRLAIYLTDGDGVFPERAPDRSVLWVVLPGGRATPGFPFGQVLRMVG